jgi:hypothetical protein
MIGVQGGRSLAEAIKINSALKKIDISCNTVGTELETHIDEILKENVLRKKMNERKLICATLRIRRDLARLRFDKMILRFVCYPVLGIELPDEEWPRNYV